MEWGKCDKKREMKSELANKTAAKAV